MGGVLGGEAPHGKSLILEVASLPSIKIGVSEHGDQSLESMG